MRERTNRKPHSLHSSVQRAHRSNPGAVSLFVGWKPAVAIILIIFAACFSRRIGLNKVMPGSSSGLVMEMFPFRAPILSNILKKTWFRFKDLCRAFPIVVIGSLGLGALYETGYLADLAERSPRWWKIGSSSSCGRMTLIFCSPEEGAWSSTAVTCAIVQYVGCSTAVVHVTKAAFVYAFVNTIYIRALLQ